MSDEAASNSIILPKQPQSLLLSKNTNQINSNENPERRIVVNNSVLNNDNRRTIKMAINISTAIRIDANTHSHASESEIPHNCMLCCIVAQKLGIFTNLATPEKKNTPEIKSRMILSIQIIMNCPS